MKNSTRYLSMLSLLLVIILGLVGCSQLSNLDVSLPEPDIDDPVSIAATPTFEAVTTPTTRPLPEGPYPPLILGFSPQKGAEVTPDSVVTVLFDQPMDRDSVTAAFQVTPEVEGDLSWEGDQTLHFSPKALASNTRYRVLLEASAQSSAGLPLSQELAFDFVTLGPLEVTYSTPANEAVELRVDTPILISFNRPVVPMDCVGAVADNASACIYLPLTVSPGVIGRGTWVNTSLYRFVPLVGWDAGVTYRVALDTDFSAVDGSQLAAPITWSFSTAVPEIKQTVPESNAVDVLLDSAITVSFNTPMDPELTGVAFALTDVAGATVPGSITWEDNGATLVFTPTQPLTLSTVYNARVGNQARALTSAPLANPRQWSFTTIPYPVLSGISPGNRSRDVAIYTPVYINFIGVFDEDAGVNSLLDKIVITPEPEEEPYAYWDAFYNRLTLVWEKLPQTEYCVQVLPGIADIYGHQTQEDVTACFETGDLDPLFTLASAMDSLTLDAEEPARLYFINRNVSNADFTLSQLTESSFIQMWDATGVALRNWTERYRGDANVPELVPVDLAARGGPLDTGLYQVAWETDENISWRSEINFAVVGRHVMLKLADDEALVWVTDLRSTAPVTQTEVRLLDTEGILIAAGTTNAEGVARIPISPRENLWDNVAAVVGAPGEPDFGIALTTWQQGANPWVFDINANYGALVPYHIYLHSDRPIYRPDQTMHFRGILRQDDDAQYALPKGESVQIVVRDSSWDVVYSNTLPVSDMGIFDGSYFIAGAASVGEYMLEANIPGVQHTWSLPFSVAAYRKPEFEVRVTPEHESLLDGERLRVAVAGAYYFGGPVANAEVQWTIRANPLFFAPESGWYWGGQGNWFYTEVVDEGVATTDAQGNFMLELPAVLHTITSENKGRFDADTPASQQWIIEATVTDDSGFTVTGSGNVAVHASRFYMGLKLRQWIASPKDKVEVMVHALDWDGVPVSGQELTVMLAEREWHSIPPTEPFEAPTWVYTDTVISGVPVTTDSQGDAVAVVSPAHSGSYIILAESTDVDGNPVAAEIPLWVTGPEAAAWRMPDGTIQPVADADTYNVGDTARILVPTPFSGTFRLLMTVERGGILETRQFVFDELNPVLELEIQETYVPNVYVSFIALQAASDSRPVPDIRVGMVKLAVNPEAQALTVEITPNHTGVYTPGEPVTLTLRTLDAAGQGVVADIGLSVVDKAVLALREANAYAILQSFYGERPLRVVTGDSLLMLFNRVIADLDELEAAIDRVAAELGMGGLGGGGGNGMAQVEVRQEFPDTAFWDAYVATDDTGAAQISFPLPDSLTTWVVDARAVTAETQVGQATAEILVTKPLLVRPVTPRFFVQGDRAQVGAIVHNNTGQDLEVTVVLTADGATVDGAGGQVLPVPNGGKARVVWTILLTENVSGTVLTFAASGGEYRDVVRPTVGTADDQGALPVYAYVSPDVVRTVGVMDEAGSRLEAVVVPEDAGEGSNIQVQLNGSLASALPTSLWYLEHRELASTEALVSRFLPSIYTYRVMQELDTGTPELEQQTREVVVDALDRLYARQNMDGGWGWWQSDSHMYMTAYTVLGLVEAQRAGFVVPENNLQRALVYLSDTLAGSLDTNERAASQTFVLYVLAEAGYPWPPKVETTLYYARDEMTVLGRAYLALAFGRVNPENPQLVTLLEELNADAEISASGAHWENNDSRYLGTDVLATAAVVDLMARFDTANPLVPQAVRWLMVARDGWQWPTGYDTAWSIMAFADYLALTGDLDAEYDWSVEFNGGPVLAGGVDSTTLEESVSLSIPLIDMLVDQPNALVISRETGPGSLYYAVDWSLLQPVESLEPDSRGFTVQREYCALQDEKAESLSVRLGGADTMAERPPCESVFQAHMGDLVEVRLTLIAPRTRYFVTLEDFYPAGMEPVQPELDTESRYLPKPELAVDVEAGEDNSLWLWNPFDHYELRDERAVFFATELPPGTYQVSYVVRAAVPGEYKVLPALASETYFPEVWGRTVGALFTVLP
ncbi:MAG: Ig-like domain-containing protein [Anaerolineae bacterium]|nr:Ig-like domain-containing protein [Anaerolineae bacterium]